MGTEAPDFVAEAVYDQEFQTISLSQYRVRCRQQGLLIQVEVTGCCVRPFNKQANNATLCAGKVRYPQVLPPCLHFCLVSQRRAWCLTNLIAFSLLFTKRQMPRSPTELTAFSDRHEEFAKLNAEVSTEASS